MGAGARARRQSRAGRGRRRRGNGAALAFPTVQLTSCCSLRGTVSLDIADREEAAERHQRAEDTNFGSSHRELLVVVEWRKVAAAHRAAGHRR